MTTQRIPNDEEIRAALERIAASESFKASERLTAFLRYVVTEALEGRAHMIRAKTLALDVYGYPVDDVSERESVVRVDAGRLRRKLEQYYAREGRTDTVRIGLPKGRYAPDFKFEADTSTYGEGDGGGAASESVRPHPTSVQRRVGITLGLLGIAGALVAAGFVLYFWQATWTWNDAGGKRAEEERTAIFEASPLRLQAINLANEGRDLLFPAVEPDRLRTALLVFESAIEQDDTYFGGYAGVAQVYALRALITPDADMAADYIAKAVSASERALELAPEASWSQSASAAVELAQRNWERAQTLSKRALAIDSGDKHLVEFDALISLFSGDFERVIDIAGAAIRDNTDEPGFVFENAFGSAKFHLGDFEGTVAAFEDAIARGAPTGPVSAAYLMAAHYRLGNMEEARALAEKYRQTWPDHRVDLLFQRLFRDESFGLELAEGMRGAGWTPN